LPAVIMNGTGGGGDRRRRDDDGCNNADSTTSSTGGGGTAGAAGTGPPPPPPPPDEERDRHAEEPAGDSNPAPPPSFAAKGAAAGASAAASGTDDDDDDDKSHTFRKRRLSLTNLSSLAPTTTSPSQGSPPPPDSTPPQPHYDDDDELRERQAHTFRKRRLSLTQNKSVREDHHPRARAEDEDDADDAPSPSSRSPLKKRPRRTSEASVGSVGSHDASGTGGHLHRHAVLPSRHHQRRFPSKILHAGELLAGGHHQNYYSTSSGGGGGNSTPVQPPPSPAVQADNVLYRTQYTPRRQRGNVPPPPLLVLPDAATAAYGSGSSPGLLRPATQDSEPKWKRRHTVGLDEVDPSKLPFPRDVVGTYSCHGMEPIYDDDDEEDEYDDDDEPYDAVATNGGWDVVDVLHPEKQPQQQQVSEEGGDSSERKLEAQPSSSSAGAATRDNDENNRVDDDAIIECGGQIYKPVIVAKINQDRGGVAFPYGNCPRTALFAVYDGHGMGGELVSQFALHEVQRRLERHKLFSTDLETAFKETFLAVDEDLKEEVLIEPLYAGTTAVVALLQDKKLTIANVGDSRAVVARRPRDSSSSGGGKDGSSWQAIPLTEDQNPDLPAERARIVSAGGHVTDPPQPGLSARVWLDSSCTQIGLAMSRSIGDHAVAPVGVIAEPVVTTYDIDPDDEFLVLASDGVWEFLESADAVQTVAEHLDRGATKACQALIEAAAAKWHEEEGEYRDDITAIVVRLKELWGTARDGEDIGSGEKKQEG